MARPLERRPGGRWTTRAGGRGHRRAATCVLTGASPSVVRAALMAGAMLVARLGGSRAHAASALELAALLMLLAAPPVLWDVGFQLSLLATAGLIWFGAPVERRLPGWPAWIREPVALTLAAQLTTLPVILVNFERLSLVAPIANVLVVPFVPVAMLFSALAALAGRARRGAAPRPSIGDALHVARGWRGLARAARDRGLGSAAASLPYAAVDARCRPRWRVALAPDPRRSASWALRVRRRTAERPIGRRGATGASGCARRVLSARCPSAAALVAIRAGASPSRRGPTGAARDRARHRPGRRDPGRGADRRDDARRRRAGPGAHPAPARREPAVLRATHRRAWC